MAARDRVASIGSAHIGVVAADGRMDALMQRRRPRISGADIIIIAVVLEVLRAKEGHA
jgi:hypothetical protein